MTDYLYHATLDENLAGIQRQGLKPVADTRECHWGGDMAAKCLGKAYLTRDLSFALYYAWVIQKNKAEDCLQMDPDCEPPEIMLLRVPRAKLAGFLRRDKQTESDYYVQRTIPPQDIEYLHGEHCWKPLSTAKPDVIEGIATGEWREPLSGRRRAWEELDQRRQAMKNLAALCNRQKRGAR